ncbi:Bax inhibitor-1/YccA family protein [Gordonia sp. DT218]|uniref:Bax inhibitor-1/YccA family protein n=1 Tax=Gordonia hankookensis TaxID=589403 RepID=A0ABR7WEK4_9ACTN|nr:MULTISPECIES: Bax inhibitor-1/YccA family protein [Gordonia]MBD1321090.1 Bax inhibitor-1/YccA family protein [Gordonia hankookensis]NDZ96662.1 Bax inhibitor-1/YccA family protein [Streptomyces sp. SID11726]NEB23320.1 Bax inhibitor-1/YccA family protein [Streptomyces sp. SID6673]WAC54657.1 Bax inhibitor-1/YccA family protein [Gordonia sp. SL306]
MRESSNPVMRGVVRDNQTGYAGFGAGAAAAGQGAMWNQQGQQTDPYTRPAAPVTRQLTIDDVVTKTAITLGVLTISAIATYFLVDQNVGLASPLMLVGALGGLALVLVASFGRKQDNPAIVLGYAVFEGLFVGSISFVFANMVVANDTSAGALIGQAVLGTFGVFFGMLLVYKVGAIRVTPRFTRMLFAGMIGVIVLMLGNLVIGLFNGGEGFGLRNGGPLAIIFSLVCIALAAFSFLLDFDAADRLIRAGAPERAAWGVALGLTVTLVWLYVEILRLLSYFNSD